jgi:TPR repeat protein
MAPGRLRTIAAAVGFACLAVVGYKILTQKSVPTLGDPLAQNRKGCGAGDPTKGDDLNACLQLAYDLMGRSAVPLDDNAARALMKRACDQAFQQGCDALARFDETKLDFLERRCLAPVTFADSTASCLEAGRRREQGVGGRPDRKSAIEHYDSACRAGNADGCAARDRLRGP